MHGPRTSIEQEGSDNRTMANTATKWRKRVADWRASGESAEAYSARRGFTERSLRYWASRFGREDALAGPVVRLAQLVRTPLTQRDEVPRGAIVIELLDARARITVATDTERAVLATVLELLDQRGR